MRTLRGSARAPIVIAALAALVLGCARPPRPRPLIEGRPAAGAPVRRTSHVGTWREQWGIPGETDVDYHDEYRVRMEGTQPVVDSLNVDRPEDIVRVRIEGDRFDLVIHTSFDVHYRLVLDASGDVMTGTATTPDKTVPIRWDRIGE